MLDPQTEDRQGKDMILSAVTNKKAGNITWIS